MLTKMEKRDRRRATILAKEARAKWATYEDLIPLIATALRREREETGFAAMQYFFAKKAKRKAAPEPKA